MIAISPNATNMNQAAQQNQADQQNRAGSKRDKPKLEPLPSAFIDMDEEDGAM